MQAIEQTGYRPGHDIWLGLDTASSEFYKDGRYHLASETQHLTSAEFVDYLAQWMDRYARAAAEYGGRSAFSFDRTSGPQDRKRN